MLIWIDLALACLGGVLWVAFGAFAWRAWRSGERRAARRGLAVAVATAAPLFLVLLLPVWARAAVLASVIFALISLVALLCVPIGRIVVRCEMPQTRYDERDMVFARRALAPGSPAAEAYYARRPDLREIDNRMRALPGLFSMRAKATHPMPVAAARASFQFIKQGGGLVEGDFVVADEALARAFSALTPQQITAWVKELTCFYGAHSVGVTELRDYHLYSHIGLTPKDKIGQPVDLTHTHAIAFTVEMTEAMVQQSPAATEAMETAKQYCQAALIAFQLTYFLRLLGYSARAHIDEHYRVICPLVARDAGLGEIGRLGLLITPDLGPRVRLAVVTTDLALIPDPYAPDASVIDFCTFCTKCAENCPGQAIPMGERQERDGALRWRVDGNACFRYWNVVGTSCGRCMATCPYSHSALYGPQPIRWVVRRSGFARRALLWLDNAFYGHKPPPRTPTYVQARGKAWKLPTA